MCMWGGGRREGEETGKIMCVKVNFAWVCEKRGNVCVCVCNRKLSIDQNPIHMLYTLS
jgi:hypothetical protein